MRYLIAKYTIEWFCEQQVTFRDDIVNIPLKTGREQRILLVSRWTPKWSDIRMIRLWNKNAQDETFGHISFRDLSSWDMHPVSKWSWNGRKQGWFTFGTQMPRTKRPWIYFSGTYRYRACILWIDGPEMVGNRDNSPFEQKCPGLNVRGYIIQGLFVIGHASCK